MQNAEKREQCYTARDDYFQCVSENGLDACQEKLLLYSGKCPKSWKDFFDKQRERHLVLEGQAEMAKARRGDIVAGNQQQ